MDYPFGRHHHNPRRDDDEERTGEYPRPPYPASQPTYGGAYPHAPPSYGGEYLHAPPSYGSEYPHVPPSYGGAYPHAPPPPVEFTGVHHTSHVEYQNYPPPPSSYPHHTSHGFGNEEGGSHDFRPHMPSSIEGHFNRPNNHVNQGGFDLGYLVNKPTYRVYCKAGRNEYSVAIRDGKVVMAQSDPSDPTQHWYKDEKYSTKVKDEEGCPSFALVNKATGQAVKHSIAGHPVQLLAFKPDVFDESILWTESRDLGSGFRTIRMVNNVRLCIDAFHGDKDHGGVHDGTILALYESWKGDNQQWKIVPY